MTDRPILFNGAMVRALLDGSKTQTRRPLKPQPYVPYPYYDTTIDHHPVEFERDGGLWIPSSGGTSGNLPYRGTPIKCPYGVPGDRLWVQEAFALSKSDPDSGADTRYSADWDVPVYRADVPSSMTSPSAVTSWKPSVHMPRWASRITLEVIGVRVERVASVSEADAESEGIRKGAGGNWLDYQAEGCFYSARHSFASLWDSIYSEPGLRWEDSPWVWAVDFKVVRP